MQIHKTHPYCNTFACVRRAERKYVRRHGVKGIAYLMLRRRGGRAQWSCLEALWQKESGWRVQAHNPSTGAHGIPQALPGSKMGPGWENNPVVQIRWGLDYVYDRYGGPCGAWGHFRAFNWY